MKRILVMSDTHGHLDDSVAAYFEGSDEIWHAGDIGTLDLPARTEGFGLLRAVWGNIDDQMMRRQFHEVEVFDLEGFKIMIIHIAGQFERYTPKVRELIAIHKPGILVCGHSHILKIAFDKKNQLLYLNPGAAGIHGFHKVRTLVRFNLEENRISGMEVIELGR